MSNHKSSSGEVKEQEYILVHGEEKKLIKTNECVEIIDQSNIPRIVRGPCEVALYDSKIRYLKRVEALSHQYIVVKQKNGSVHHIRGPAEEFLLPHHSTLTVENLCILREKDIAHAVRRNGKNFTIDGPIEYMPDVGETIVFVVRAGAAPKPMRPWSYYDRLGQANHLNQSKTKSALANDAQQDTSLPNASLHSLFSDCTSESDDSQRSSATMWNVFSSLFGGGGNAIKDKEVEEFTDPSHLGNDLSSEIRTGKDTVLIEAPPGELSTTISRSNHSARGNKTDALSYAKPAVPWSYYSTVAQSRYDGDHKYGMASSMRSNRSAQPHGTVQASAERQSCSPDGSTSSAVKPLSE